MKQWLIYYKELQESEIVVVKTKPKVSLDTNFRTELLEQADNYGAFADCPWSLPTGKGPRAVQIPYRTYIRKAGKSIEDYVNTCFFVAEFGKSNKRLVSRSTLQRCLKRRS